MKLYVKPLAVYPGTHSGEQLVAIATADGCRVEHFISDCSLNEDGLIRVTEASNYALRPDQLLVHFPYCNDPLTAWIATEDLIYALP